MALACVEEDAGFLCLFQHSAAPVVEGQHPGVGGGGLHVRFRQSQKCAHHHPVQPGPGVPLGLGGGDDLFEAGLAAAGVHEFSPQALGTVGEGFEFLVGHGAKSGENGPLSGGKSMNFCTLKNGRHLLGHIPLPVAALRQQPPQGGGGGIFVIGEFVMVAALPGDGHGTHFRVPGRHGFAVFDSENIVGACNQFTLQAHPGKGLLPGGGEGQALFQLIPEDGREVLGQKRPGGGHQGIAVCIFGTEAQLVAEIAQNRHASIGEALGRGQGVMGGQLQHQVGACGNGGSGPEGFVKNGRSAPLDEAAAHQTDDGRFRAAEATNHAHLLPMAQMQGVIFTDDSDCFQNFVTFS